MHDFDDDPEPAPPLPYALCVWAICAALLAGPPILVWVVRLTALAIGCAPGAGLCHGMALGGGLRDALALSWLIGGSPFLGIFIGFVSAVAALCIRRPLMASLSLLVLPIVSVLLPIAAVSASTYLGCQVNEDGIGDCVLWGAKMGMSFHEAAVAASTLGDTMPYTFALALMMGAIGFVFFRPKGAR
jgi:hypothetical protein